jgi:hypothetical protein
MGRPRGGVEHGGRRGGTAPVGAAVATTHQLLDDGLLELAPVAGCARPGRWGGTGVPPSEPIWCCSWGRGELTFRCLALLQRREALELHAPVVAGHGKSVGRRGVGLILQTEYKQRWRSATVDMYRRLRVETMSIESAGTCWRCISTDATVRYAKSPFVCVYLVNLNRQTHFRPTSRLLGSSAPLRKQSRGVR